jgi:hypothetical protein
VSLHCPKCGGVIYTRRNKLCGFCGAQLPTEFLLSDAEIAALDKAEAARNEQQAKERAEELERLKDAGPPPDYYRS